MPGHSRSKNGVASLAYAPGIHVFEHAAKDVDGRDKPGHHKKAEVSNWRVTSPPRAARDS